MPRPYQNYFLVTDKGKDALARGTVEAKSVDGRILFILRDDEDFMGEGWIFTRGELTWRVQELDPSYSSKAIGLSLRRLQRKGLVTSHSTAAQFETGP